MGAWVNENSIFMCDIKTMDFSPLVVYYRKFDSTARIGRYVAVQPCLSQGKCRDSLKIRFTFHRGIRLLTTVKNFWIIVADFIFLQIVNIIG